jgi:hypothetical protein
MYGWRRTKRRISKRVPTSKTSFVQIGFGHTVHTVAGWVEKKNRGRRLGEKFLN